MIERLWIIVVEYGGLLLAGLQVTLYLSLVGTIIGFILAVLFGSVGSITIERNDRFYQKTIKYVVQMFIRFYVTVIRGTPMIVQAMIFYYGFYMIGIRWSPIQAGLFTVSVNTGAYLTEVVKNGIRSVDIGQEEAAKSLGMNRFKTMIFIVLPQAIKTQMAAIGNEFIINIKDTAVLNVIWVVDLYAIAKTAASDYYWYFEAMVVAAIIYLIVTYGTSRLLRIIEKRLGAPHRELPSAN